MMAHQPHSSKPDSSESAEPRCPKNKRYIKRKTDTVPREGKKPTGVCVLTNMWVRCAGMSNNVHVTTCMAAGGHVKACLLNPDIPCWGKRPIYSFLLSRVRKQAVIPHQAEGTSEGKSKNSNAEEMKSSGKLSGFPDAGFISFSTYDHKYL